MENQTDETEKLKNKSEFEDLQALIKRTDKANPNPEDLAAMKKHLDKNFHFIELNNISGRAFNKAAETTSDSELMREIYRRQMEEKRKSLGIETASPIEQILIDQIVLCWFRLNHIEMIHAAKQAESHTYVNGLYWDKKLSSAQRRLLKACETLAKVQKHLTEANLREQQARNSRGKSAILANKLLKELS